MASPIDFIAPRDEGQRAIGKYNVLMTHFTTILPEEKQIK